MQKAARKRRRRRKLVKKKLLTQIATMLAARCNVLVGSAAGTADSPALYVPVAANSREQI